MRVTKDMVNNFEQETTLDDDIGRDIISKSISEMRGKNLRLYFKMKGEIMEIIGYSSKSNQQQVIDRLIKIYGKL